MRFNDIRNEARLGDHPEVNYTDSETASSTKVVAQLNSYKSGVYTKLAQKLTRLEAIKAETKELTAEIKQYSRENVADIFDAEDAASTRVVDTLQFIFTMTKDPKATEAPQYKKILEALETQFTPELMAVYTKLKEEMVTVTQKAPALKVIKKDESVNEGIGSVFTKIKNAVMSWGQKYDAKLDALKAQVGM
jgi:hypothetical protein|tara:strand:- start:20 stop:595 length:576 start_codon:yes stop_codon:yes gene_type:complete